MGEEELRRGGRAVWEGEEKKGQTKQSATSSGLRCHSATSLLTAASLLGKMLFQFDLLALFFNNMMLSLSGRFVRFPNTCTVKREFQRCWFAEGNLDRIDLYGEERATIQCSSRCQTTPSRFTFPQKVPEVSRTCNASETDFGWVLSSNKVLDSQPGLLIGFQGLCELPEMLHKMFYLLICPFQGKEARTPIAFLKTVFL